MRKGQVPHLLESFSRKEIYIASFALLAFIISGGLLLKQVFGQTGPGPHRGGELVEGLAGQPQFINPLLAPASSVDTDLSRIVFAQLLKFNPAGQVEPDLAESVPAVSEDQKTYTLKLKPGLKWQDGQPLTAEDVLFTIEAIQDVEYQSPLRPNWARVRVEKVDELTLTFQLREVSAGFMNNFALGILPKHVWATIPRANFRLADANLKPIGSGPFAVTEIKKTSAGLIRSIELEANHNYHEGRPYLDRVVFKFYPDYNSLLTAYQGRDIQSLGFVPFDQKAFLAEKNNYTQYRASLPQYQAVFFNLAKNATLGEKAVRQALWLATDRQQIIDEAYMGNSTAAYGPLLPESLGYDPAVAQAAHVGLEEAAGILDRAGWTLNAETGLRNKGERALEFNLAVSNLPLSVKTAQILQSQWAKVGAKVNLVVVSEYDLQQEYIRPRSFDALLFAENTGADPDPYPFWHSSQVRDPGLNFSGFNHAQADQLITQGRQTTDSNARANSYRQFQAIVNDQLPAIFLLQSVYIYHVPSRIQGIDLNHITQPSDRFTGVHLWHEE